MPLQASSSEVLVSGEEEEDGLGSSGEDEALGGACVCLWGVRVCSHTCPHPGEQDPAVGHLDEHPRQAQRKRQRSL